MNTKEHTYINFIRNVRDVLILFVIYYFTYFLSCIVLTSLVIKTGSLAGYSLQNLISKREATIRGIIGGLSMLIGIVPLLPNFKREIGNRQGSRHEADMQVKSVQTVKITTHTKTAKNEKTLSLYSSVPITITLAIVSSVAINILFIRFHLTEVSETYSQVAEHQYGVSLAIGLFLYGIISPLAEEVVFRGIIYNRIRKNCSIPVAVFLSALLFGLYHGNIVQGAYGFFMGALLAYTYEQFGSFFHAFLFHAAANTAVYTITSNEVVYNLLITPHIGVVFTLISVFLLWMMKRYSRNRIE